LEEYDSVVSAVVGRQIVRVQYYGLSSGHGDQWDFGQWHLSEMGVELTVDTGDIVSFDWGDAFGHFHLEAFNSAMSNHLAGVGTPNGPRVWEVTGHVRWGQVHAGSVRAMELIWVDDIVDSDRPAPVAVRLTWDVGSVWVVAAEPKTWPPADEFWLGMDAVLVAFTEDFRRVLGLPHTCVD
jgi:hypothetical protein